MNVIEQLQKHEKDTGSSAVQIAVLTQEISRLTTHLNANKKDVGCRRSILKKVATRKRFLTYLKRKDIGTYKKTLELLNLKK